MNVYQMNYFYSLQFPSVFSYTYSTGEPLEISGMGIFTFQMTFLSPNQQCQSTVAFIW